MVRVLSIDGGGIRGVIPARIIIELENILRVKTNKPVSIADYFDLISGASTGAILAIMYLIPERLSSSDILNIYYQNGDEIFKQSFLNKITFGLFKEKYDNKNLRKILTNYLHDLKLSDLTKDCLVPSFDLEQYRSIFFTRPKDGSSKDFYLTDVLLSASAAPTYFDPHRMESVDKTIKHVNVDGGLFANNPAMCALVEACKTYKCQLDDVCIVSVGTGMKSEECLSIPYERAKRWGLFGWLSPLINIMMYGTSNIVHHQLKILYSYLNSDYYRLQPVFSMFDMNDISLKMDDASKHNIEALIMKTENYIIENYSKLISVADELIEMKKKHDKQS